MTDQDDLFDRLDALVQRALDGENVAAELAELAPEAKDEFAAMLAAQGGELPPTSMATPTAAAKADSTPRGSKVVADFLEAYWQDKSEGIEHDLAYYLKRHPGDVEALAQCYFALAAPSSSAASTSSQERQLGSYRLTEVVGRGGQATVYLAEDQKLQRQVALKVFEGANAIGKRALERFKREARAVSKISHPNIGRVYEADVVDGLPYIAMELIAGESMALEIDRRRSADNEESFRISKRDLDDRIRVLWAVAEGLAAAHAAGVIHRDLKPANIMRRADGSPVLLDFGLAKIEDDDAVGITGTLDLLGTPAYIAPERLQNPNIVASRREDIYALGVTAFEYLTGIRPFQAPTVEELYRRKLRGDAETMESIIPGVSRDLAVVVQTAMELDPARRYQDAASLAADFRCLIDGAAVSVRPIGATTKIARWYRRNAVVATLTLAIVITLSLFSYLTWRKNKNIENLRHEAVERGDDLARSLDDVLELSDVKRVDDLIDEAEALWPIAEATLPRMERWLKKARDLVARSERHNAALATLQGRRLSLTEEDIKRALPTEFQHHQEFQERLAAYRESTSALSPEQATAAIGVEELLEARFLSAYQNKLRALEESHFPSAADSWRAQLLSRLKKQLQVIGNEDEGLIKTIRQRATEAKTLATKTIQEQQEAWIKAAGELQDDPRFAGFHLEPIEGFIPLGRDPQSGLQEFQHHLSSGVDEVLKRQADGKLPELRPENGLIMVLLPGGTFQMGAITDPNAEGYDRLATEGESPRHEVQLAAFLISKYEVWQGAYTRLAGINPSAYKPGSTVLGTEVVSELHPAEFMNWYDVRAVLHRFDMELPTEAQWEYAARAGQETIWSFGNDPMQGAGRINIIDATLGKLAGEQVVNGSGIGEHNDGYALHGPVNRYEPNAFGLHQMHGNVYEWCLDSYATYDFPVRKDDGFRLGSINNNDMRIFRGGAYGYSISQARSTNRSGTEAASTNEVVGVRPVFTIKHEVQKP